MGRERPCKLNYKDGVWVDGSAKLIHWYIFEGIVGWLVKEDLSANGVCEGQSASHPLTSISLMAADILGIAVAGFVASAGDIQDHATWELRAQLLRNSRYYIESTFEKSFGECETNAVRCAYDKSISFAIWPQVLLD